MQGVFALLLYHIANENSCALNLPSCFVGLQNLLVMRLQQLEDDGSGERLNVGVDGEEVSGLRQRDLLEWYFKYLVEK